MATKTLTHNGNTIRVSYKKNKETGSYDIAYVEENGVRWTKEKLFEHRFALVNAIHYKRTTL